MKLPLAAAAALAALALSGCSDPPRAVAQPEPAAFEPEAQGEGPVVFLRGRAEGQHVVLEVVARDAADVHGIAFRVGYDPGEMTFVDATSGGAWTSQSVALAREGAPGQVAVVWSEKGSALGVDAREETTLGTLRFDLRGRKGTAVTFRTDRSQILDSKGAPLAVSWYGGAVPAR